MDLDHHHLPHLLPFISTILALLLLVHHLLRKSKRDQKKKEPPEAAGGWPIIGHLPLLQGLQPPHITLGNMADKYGPIFTIRMGIFKTLVVSNSEMAKECFTTNDKVFANRPKLVANDILGYNYAMIGFSPYGSYWRQVRKIATVEVLSHHRIEKLCRVRESEVKISIKELYELWANDNSVVVEMKNWFGDVALNLIFRMVVGKRYLEATALNGDECRKAFRDFFELTGIFVVSDAIPHLRWLDLGGHVRAMKKTAKVLDQLIQGWLEEHKLKRSNSEGQEEKQDFMDVMLSILESTDLENARYDADKINKATSLTLILAGTDTATVTLTWALALLLNNRGALKKAQQELDEHVGRDRQVKESDLNKLVYLQAILKETLRLYPAAPLSVPHESMEDCTVGGYHVPKGIRLLVNLSKIHRDPKIWSDPNEFRPERFLTTHKAVDVRGQNFELIPFGSGRRMCPGVSLALQFMQLTLAALLHGFDMATPSNEAVDMSEKFGLTNMKASPLDVLLTPRLPANLYH
ncbi:cytochrome P450 CYP82D47-like [Ziziphus jujuba]|uniref:Cytochrome P450 CYP82D47-like n=1 Tax=Ziziphus jujuba TaxID=326968 RepID=A0ABM4A8C1_ZIZJJ|nr:cytochrome P450 CYP82D47-like [Ziziphus jujuba]